MKDESSSSDYGAVLAELKTFPAPLLPPGHSYSTQLTATIAALQLHPTLEAALHLLNHDLPSAHFLVRHMQSPPAVEGMTLHAILHRIEGDFDNARAWYGDVAGDGEGEKLLKRAWSSENKNEAQAFVDKVQNLKNKDQDEIKTLAALSEKEIMAVLEWCEAKFGTESWTDASSAWVEPSDKIKQIGQDMTTGKDGFRDF